MIGKSIVLEVSLIMCGLDSPASATRRMNQKVSICLFQQDLKTIDKGSGRTSLKLAQTQLSHFNGRVVKAFYYQVVVL